MRQQQRTKLSEERSYDPQIRRVHVEPVAERRYRVLHSPGFVDGVAAGDEIEVLQSDGSFRVVYHGGNLAIQVFSASAIGPLRDQLNWDVRAQLSGWVDGGIERALVFTVPVTTGFARVERFFANVVATHPGLEWSYGNVYDPVSREPLRWWERGA